MKTHPSTGLFWFRQDLRIEDNLALRRLASQVDTLVCVYVVDPAWFKHTQHQSRHMGEHRWRFLKQSLEALTAQLQNLGQRLHIVYDEPVPALSSIIEQYQVTHVAANAHPGVYERGHWQQLRQLYPQLEFGLEWGNTLYAPEQLPFELSDLPKSFTPFRKKVEDVRVDRPSQTPDALPSSPVKTPGTLSEVAKATPNTDADSATGDDRVKGGSHNGLAQLEYYLFETDRIATYKETRNGLDGWDYSSKLSFWLADGSISPRQVMQRINEYEHAREKNESTYWLKFELLWREYFQWYAFKHKHKVFTFSGVQERKPLSSFWPQRFAAWANGNTPYPIVNAFMRQLNQTGYMSNRGRQLVASCLVNELNLDWRYGAAYFEQLLIDYDVASNWGNWQYLAGVGADPRGKRRFDLNKQTRMYDPDGEFIARWGGQEAVAPIDNVDETDWPIRWQ